jgi:hypothetical protein
MVVINQHDKNNNPHGLWIQGIMGLDKLWSNFPESIQDRIFYDHGSEEGESVQLGYNKIYKHLYGND